MTKSSAISTPIVPCPAITSRSSNGATGWYPRTRAISLVAAILAASVGSTRISSAPVDAIASVLTAGAFSGTTIAARTPRSRAAYATANP